MTTIKTVSSLSADLDAPTQSLLGLAALAAELAAQGVSVKDLFARTGVQPWQLEDPQARISHRQRLMIYRNARALWCKSFDGVPGPVSTSDNVVMSSLRYPF